jgi:hypothetical protein
VDPGATELARIRRLPDPRIYGLQIHPMLVASCATAGCHGQPSQFELQAAEQALTPETQISHPLDLPEPFRSGYYTVLGASDLEVPEASRLLRWATGAEPSHPGGRALEQADQTALLAWLRSGGGSP